MFIEIFDTTLRDGTQGEGVNISVQDKLLIAKRLDEFGIDVIEGGWPGSNPRDEMFFKQAKNLKFSHAKLCAFGSTARSLSDVEGDINLNALVDSDTPVVSIFGKTWQLHSQKGLGLTDDENGELIYKSVKYLKSFGRRVIFDAEHFFDGYKHDPKFALSMLESAVKGGSDTLVLCDTNGGSLPTEVFEIVTLVKKEFGDTRIGIHTHNDSELAVANSLTAIQAGATHVQGTFNGVGERCGNANLCSIIPNLILKMNLETNQKNQLSSLASVSNYVYELINIHPNTRAAYIGKSAFAHKGGIHVSAVIKDNRMYEHIQPELVGNKQRVLVSDLSGQSNVKYKAKEVGIDLSEDKELSKKVVDRIKSLEYNGYQFDGAEASFELILRSEKNEFSPFFKLIDSKVNVFYDDAGNSSSEAVLKIEVNNEIEHTASNGDGPVNALDRALRKALLRFYPEISEIKLIDYKVRVLDEKDGTAAKVRVMIESSDKIETWGTVGVSTNIIEASFKALSDSINYKLFQYHKGKQELAAK
ncbi:MAG: citramalate synthase [Bacteroidetes bacterium]|nr:citramalate synthase [Bacteroidota bacterium]MBU1677389.1 citramalate synthase [Bacteroidota bacterium]